MPPSPHLSLVLACYNEEETLRESFAEIRDTLEGMQRPFEVVFVDDVSRDRTREVIRDLVASHPALDLKVILHETNQGRGTTVSDGFRAARGFVAGYLDVDLEVHSRYIPSLVRAIEQGADVATLRRIYAFQLRSLDRYVMSRGYSFLVRHLLDVPLLDTETGYKFFRREALLPVLDAIEDGRWFWDTEFMVRAARRGLRIEEIPGAYIRRFDKHLDRPRPPRLARLLRPAAAVPPAVEGGAGVKALDEIGWREGGALRLPNPRHAPLPPGPLSAPAVLLAAAPGGAHRGAHRPPRRAFLQPLPARACAGLEIGDECFLGDECLLDLAEGVRLESQTTLAERVLVLTHTNVGYRDHPLQRHFPAMAAPVTIRRGAFVGANVTVLPGVEIGAGAFVAAGSVVTKSVPPTPWSRGCPPGPCASWRGTARRTSRGASGLTRTTGPASIDSYTRAPNAFGHRRDHPRALRFHTPTGEASLGHPRKDHDPARATSACGARAAWTACWWPPTTSGSRPRCAASAARPS